jgi:hypothetical protein
MQPPNLALWRYESIGQILSLPEWLSGVPGQAVRPRCRGCFQPAHYLRQLRVRQQNDVNMIWHDDPSDEIVAAANPRAIAKRFHKRRGDLRIPQRARTVPGVVQLAIMQHKRSPRVRIIHEQRGFRLRDRPCQSPCDEYNRACWNPMWKLSSPEQIFLPW